MTLKNNLIAWGCYTLIIYILIFYFKGYLYSIPISIIIGFTLSILNNIAQTLNRINQKLTKK
jgi:hypothetical protein